MTGQTRTAATLAARLGFAARGLVYLLVGWFARAGANETLRLFAAVGVLGAPVVPDHAGPAVEVEDVAAFVAESFSVYVIAPAMVSTGASFTAVTLIVQPPAFARDTAALIVSRFAEVRSERSHSKYTTNGGCCVEHA